MRKIALVLAFVLPAFALAASDKLTVMSYNMRYGKANDGDNSWSVRCIATPPMIEDCSPDVFGVQECYPFQAYYILENCPQYDGYGIGREDGENGERTQIFWRKDKFTVLDKGTFWLSETPDIPSKGWDAKCSRTATWALMENMKTHRKFFFVNTHLDHVGKVAAVEGLNLIYERINAMNPSEYPMVLTGDFNLADTSRTILDFNSRMTNSRIVAKKLINDVGTFHNFGKRNDHFVIDYIYYNGLSRCISFETVTESYLDIPFVSDHYPIVAVLKF